MSETNESVLAGIFEDNAPAPPPALELEAPEPVAQEPEPVEEPAADPEPEEHIEPDPLDPRTVPLKAYQAQRRERQDYKTKAAVAEEQAKTAREEAEALRARIAELEKPKPAPAPTETQQPVRLPNPIEDPQGYANAISMQRWSDKLDLAQDAFEEANPTVNVDSLVTRFKAEVEKDPSLASRFRVARNPYKFAHQQIQRIDAMAEIGPDPAAFRAKLEAELRAVWEAERTAPAGGPAVVTPRPAPNVANLRPSLAATRAAPPGNTVASQGNHILDGVFPNR